jgi:DNA helicase IV
MAKRRFDLPGIEDLNKDQDKVLRLPPDGQFLVVGGPGTGKSVVALLRTLKHQQDNNYLFLTYNHVLRASTIQCIESQLESDTAWSWYYKLIYGFINESVPQIAPYKPDYEKIIKISEELNFEEGTDFHLIIDEGQDMPQGFYDSLMYLGYENFFIVADQNQQITEENSSRQELTDMLGLEVTDVIELKENYRNNSPIAILSQYFYTDIASPKPELPNKPSSNTPILYEYEQVDSCVKMMLREADRDNSKLIGLIVASDTKREDYVKRLKNADINRDNEKPVISSYKQADKGNVAIDFGQGGIVVLNDKSVKGIEFDVVFIVLDGLKLFQNDTESMKKRMYVMTSRAKEKLVLFKGMSCDKAVSDLLPQDNSILERGTI